MSILLSRSIGGVFVDVVISEEHTSEMEIAEHPVEQGAKISDHAWRTPRKLRLESVVDSSRAVASFNALLALQATAEPFSIVTGLTVYSNMLIKSLVATRDKEKARVLFFTADLQEVIIVNTAESSGQSGGQGSGSETSEDGAQGTTSRGQVQARSVDTSSLSSSQATRLLDGAVGAD
ncbi:phage baseplate protein [Alsobacter sp. KACC 23698]|uniref:Phage baseplate protein n=1 Tax=Alsobacter sp. KACC 23698 TaxID=3149229 RepID=A0AAU7JMW3_9HYPH